MTVEVKSRDLQVFLNNSKRSQHMQLSLIRKRSLVRVQAGPQANNAQFAGKTQSIDEGQEQARPSFTPIVKIYPGCTIQAALIGAVYMVEDTVK